MAAVWGIQMTPPAPAILPLGTQVTVTFEYWSGGDNDLVQVTFMPLAEDGSEAGTATQDWYWSGGQGTASFTVTTGPVAVNRIFVYMLYGGDDVSGDDWFYLDTAYFFGESGSVTGIQLTPASPADLFNGANINIGFNYTIGGEPVRIFFLPLTGGVPASNVSGSDSPPYAGSGSGNAGFTITSGSTVVDEIQALMTDESKSNIWADFRFPVHFTFSEPTAIRATTWGRLKAFSFAGD